MKLIGAGLPRTGTLSQKIALEMLGAGPCYHMVTVLGDLDRVPLWLRALDGDTPWERIFAGYESTVDWPAGFFYRELIDTYPDAKVLLSTRDADRWEQSMRATIWEVSQGSGLTRHLSEARARIDPKWAAYNTMTSAMLWQDHGTLAGVADGRETYGQALQRHNDEVKATVPADRLLVWKAADGWGPLCEFLGVPVPEQPFPHAHDSEMFQERVIEGSLAALNSYWAERHRTGG